MFIPPKTSDFPAQDSSTYVYICPATWVLLHYVPKYWINIASTKTLAHYATIEKLAQNPKAYRAATATTPNAAKFVIAVGAAAEVCSKKSANSSLILLHLTYRRARARCRGAGRGSGRRGAARLGGGGTSGCGVASRDGGGDAVLSAAQGSGGESTRCRGGVELTAVVLPDVLVVWA